MENLKIFDRKLNDDFSMVKKIVHTSGDKDYIFTYLHF